MAYKTTAVREFREVVAVYIHRMDEVMKLPSTNEKGKKVASLINQLDMALQIFDRYGKEIKAVKPKGK